MCQTRLIKKSSMRNSEIRNCERYNVLYTFKEKNITRKKTYFALIFFYSQTSFQILNYYIILRAWYFKDFGNLISLKLSTLSKNSTLY